MSDAESILAFWFGELDERGFASEAKSALWWTKDRAFDEQIRTTFMGDYEAIEKGEREAWLESPRSWLAYLIVLDQFSRNMFRDSPRMFEADERALRQAEAGISKGFDRALPFDLRGFCYLPLVHAEHLDAQARCIELFTAFRDEVTGEARERVERSLSFAKRHQEIIARFGRFPHRNAITGRVSTADEIEFLRQPGSSF